MPGEVKAAKAAGGASVPNANARSIEIIFVDLAEVRSALAAAEAETPRLSDADLARAEAISDERQRELWRTARIATRVVLERFGGVGLRRVPFHIEAGGRPVLGEGAPYFSISHSAGIALIAVGAHVPLGVDLEVASRRLKMSEGRRQRIVAAAERLGVGAALTADRDADVLTAWVGLEAIAKARGSGIGRLLTEEGVVGGQMARAVDDTGPQLDVRGLDVGPDYLAAIASLELPPELKVRRLPVADVAGFLRGE